MTWHGITWHDSGNENRKNNAYLRLTHNYHTLKIINVMMVSINDWFIIEISRNRHYLVLINTHWIHEFFICIRCVGRGFCFSYYSREILQYCHDTNAHRTQHTSSDTYISHFLFRMHILFAISAEWLMIMWRRQTCKNCVGWRQVLVKRNDVYACTCMCERNKPTNEHYRCGHTIPMSNEWVVEPCEIKVLPYWRISYIWNPNSKTQNKEWQR